MLEIHAPSTSAQGWGASCNDHWPALLVASSSSSLASSAGILSVTTIVQAFTLRPMERSYGAQSCQTKRPGGPRSSMFQQKLISSPSRYLQFSANRFPNFIGRSTLVRSTTLTRWSRSRLQHGKLTTTENRWGFRASSPSRRLCRRVSTSQAATSGWCTTAPEPRDISQPSSCN